MRAALAALLVALLPAAASAAPDVADGEKLVKQHKCEGCHETKVWGPPGAIYTRKDRKVTTWPKLKSQVEACNTMLNVGLFPDDEEHVATYLNATYYKLPTK
jgi:cytochrome c5